MEHEGSVQGEMMVLCWEMMVLCWEKAPGPYIPWLTECEKKLCRSGFRSE